MSAQSVNSIDAVVIGGGPAGSAIGRLLAAWGHSVRILAKPYDRSRGLGESLPPSTRKLLDAIDVLDLVDRAGFYKTTGNTVWWASRERRVEAFESSAFGYQVFRPDFDRVLLEHAASAGAEVIQATVRRVDLGPATAAVEYEQNGQRHAVDCRVVVDASGRAGVVAKSYRRHEPNHRMYALVGVWAWSASDARSAEASAERHLTDPTHTVVETYEDGWAWSVPISATTRHVGTMVDGTSPRVTSGRALADAYRAEIDKTVQIARMLDTATLQHAFACDASLYSSDPYAGPRFLLVGDAGSFIDPLSSFGVKKALASAWVGAVVVHTGLTHPDRQAAALDFFTRWERDVYATHLRRSRDFARAAHAQHPHPFWAARASTEVPEPDIVDETALMRDPDVQAAFETLKQSADVALALAADVRFARQSVIRGREIVLEDAIPLAGLKPCATPHETRQLQTSDETRQAQTPDETRQPRTLDERRQPQTPDGRRQPQTPDGRRQLQTDVAQPFRAASIRFLNNVDLVALAELARRHDRVPDLVDEYNRVHGAVPLPNILGALSFLVAKGILAQRV